MAVPHHAFRSLHFTLAHCHHWLRMLKLALLVILLLLCPCLGKLSAAQSQSISLPMSIDMVLLRSLIVAQAYREPGERAKVLILNKGCNELWLEKPAVRQDGGKLRFQTGISITWGTPLTGNCYAPIVWRGSLVLMQQPELNSLWQLRFVTLDSALFDQGGQPAQLANLLWNLIKDHVHAYLNTIQIDLAPPVSDLKDFILAQTGEQPSREAQSFLTSMRPEQPTLRDNKLKVDILAEVSLQQGEAVNDESSAFATPEAQKKVIELWQSWDAMLVRLITQLSDSPLTSEDQQLLLDTILAVRYEFSDTLSRGELTNSFVRSQFIRAWKVLEPLFRRHLVAAPGNNMLGYLSFFTAADALTALDRIGPSIGIDISRDGFFRMARMLGDEPLNESGQVDQRLRTTLGLEPEPSPPDQVDQDPDIEAADPTAPVKKHESDPTSNRQDAGLMPWLFNPSRWQVWHFLTPAETLAAQPSLEEVSSWTAELTPADKLLPRVQKLLSETARLQQNKLNGKNIKTDWFLTMLQATAWQESCFRQFVVKDKKITYLLSYNNTSVGLMQINEKIWRGIYNLQELRWNIRYNSNAGAEILTLYLNRYIGGQKTPLKVNSPAEKRYLASLLYALYNGGPGQLNKFPGRSKSGKLYQSDKLFLDKYDQLNTDGWLSAVTCLPTS